MPLVYFSVNLMRSLHPIQTYRPGGPTMHPSMVRAMLFNVAAFTLVYVALTAARMAISRLEDAHASRQMAAAGSAVVPPKLSGAVDG